MGNRTAAQECALQDKKQQKTLKQIGKHADKIDRKQKQNTLKGDTMKAQKSTSASATGTSITKNVIKEESVMNAQVSAIESVVESKKPSSEFRPEDIAPEIRALQEKQGLVWWQAVVEFEVVDPSTGTLLARVKRSPTKNKLSWHMVASVKRDNGTEYRPNSGYFADVESVTVSLLTFLAGHGFPVEVELRDYIPAPRKEKKAARMVNQAHEAAKAKAQGLLQQFLALKRA